MKISGRLKFKESKILSHMLLTERRKLLRRDYVLWSSFRIPVHAVYPLPKVALYEAVQPRHRSESFITYSDNTLADP